MKYFISALTTTLFIITISTTLLSQVNYVNINATGADNGTSWNDAYTSLSDALENSVGGDIWIAAGNYTPTSPMMDSTTTFRLSNRYSIYGGFNGTESSVEERDIINNVTVLNADINGDDMDGDFDLNKNDNVQHVIFIDSLITDAIVLDGLTITGGYTGENGGQSESFFAGGGVFSYSTVEINNCTFINNYAARGGAVCVSNSTDGGDYSIINNCSFIQNRTSAQSAGIYASEVQGLRIENSDFTNNQTNRGAIQLSNTENSEIVNCNFIDNEGISTIGFGGALFSWQNRGLNITGCTFNNNIAGNGAVMYLDGRNVGDTEQTEITITDCSFDNNMTLDYGGSCVYAWQVAGLDVGECQFTNNQGGNGGVMYLDGRELGAINSLRNVFSNCTFTDNRASDFGGGVLYNYQASCQFNTCTFTDNYGN